MGSQVEDFDSWTSETNWAITQGSLDSTVAFESSLSPLADDSLNSSPKTPLILKPPSIDSGPCEIKISFSHKHEVRQVYVRSTARIYEIYYASNQWSTNEYLCTVRCSAAAIYEDVSPKWPEESMATSGEGTPQGSSGRSSNEDDWVEVKASDPSLLDKNQVSSQVRSVANAGSMQNFYEATAEITDADPSTCLTLRLLSLQNKECVYVDEVYVFADPIDSDYPENPAEQKENSAGSSLMAMLVPTLMQFSKAGIGRAQEKHACNSTEKQLFQENKIEETTGTKETNVLDKLGQEGKCEPANGLEVGWQQEDGSVVKSYQSEKLTRVPDTANKTDSDARVFSLTHIGRTLNQLVSRVARIEDFCLRFEENMLKPISGMETRLQQLEQQLEALTKKSESFRPPPCTGASSSEPFLCELESSLCQDGIHHKNCVILEPNKIDLPSDKLSVQLPSDNVPVSVNATQLSPSLIVTAPEFPSADDKGEEEDSDQLNDCPEDEPKKSLSIDDALASALAGFLSSTSVQVPNYVEALAVKAPDFPNDDDTKDPEIDIPEFRYEMPRVCLGEISSPRSEEELLSSLNHDYFEQKAEGLEKSSQPYEEGKLSDIQDHDLCAQDKHDVTSLCNGQITEETDQRGTNSPVSSALDPDETDTSNQFLNEQTSHSSDSNPDGMPVNMI
ncbi:hypothetical protein RJ641_004960 [Dillenia turbinata]|uniref:Uncharacterized protein n=1 Tax=Dillenia turbinata TaxID=194707 RepID=A0AAN8ZB09_9MAGN